MKCPLLHHKEHNPDVFPGETFEDCLKEECAWWDVIDGKCEVCTLRYWLREVAIQMQAVKERTPKDLTPRG